MSYHANLWITTGAAAPVLLIAAFVPYFDVALARLTKAETPFKNTTPGIKTLAFIVGLLCVSLDEFLFIASLYSLATNQDFLPPLAVVIITSFIMFALVTIAAARGMAPLLADNTDKGSDPSGNARSIG